jgi:hypothetical protein
MSKMDTSRRPDTTGARLNRAPEGHPGRVLRHAKNQQTAFWFQAVSENLLGLARLAQACPPQRRRLGRLFNVLF